MPRIRCFLIEWSEADEAYRRCDTGELLIGKKEHPGAMYFADPAWSESVGNPGPDGRHLFVATPGGMWGIDSEASNCTRPGDKTHHCWVRHGEAPEITVDKNGETCGCGCSIAVGDYHGFLRDGFLIDA